MKNILLILFTISVFLSCESTSSVGPTVTAEEQFAIDLGLIDKYLTDNGITAEIDSLNGLRYVIQEPGEGDTPSSTANVTVNYEGRHLESQVVFDAGENVAFPLNGVIFGWQLGVPLIKEGGSITLYIPSGYAYGTQGRGNNIGPNAILVFDIDLTNVQN